MTNPDPAEARREAVPPKFTVNDQGDHVCEHGTAIDVHCCNCHGGFLSSADVCVCVFDPEKDCAQCEAYKVRIQVLQESIDGCAKRVQELAKGREAAEEYARHLRLLLVDCHAVLANMAAENRESRNPFRPRWPIHHEPLRADARALLPRIERDIFPSSRRT